MAHHQKRPPDPSSLAPYASRKNRSVYVVVETPRGHRNKISYDEELGFFRLKKVLPEGMAFRVLGCKGPRGAWKLVERAVRNHRRSSKRSA